MNETENLIIVGSGPAGLTAALYAARANLKPLLIEGARLGGIPGGQLMIAGKIENFPAVSRETEGPGLIALMRKQVDEYGVRVVSADVTDANLFKHPFTIACEGGIGYSTASVIVASGATARRLPIKSERHLWGKGISACAVCDGALPLFRNKPVAVIGGGDSACESALHLTQFASKIYILHRKDKLRASKIMQQRILSNPKIEVLWNVTVSEFTGTELLTGIKYTDETNGNAGEIAVAGAFEAIGQMPNVGFLSGQIDLDDSGHILCKKDSTATSIEGVFAAGDICDKRYRQAITAAGSGCMAAMDAERWLMENDWLAS